MTWLDWLVIAVVITSIAAVTGIKPKGTQHLARTRMMGWARLVLLILAVVLLGGWFVVRTHVGG